MNNFIKDIARYSGENSIPKDVTLSANANFLQWEGKTKEVNVEDNEDEVDKKAVI